GQQQQPALATIELRQFAEQTVEPHRSALRPVGGLTGIKAFDGTAAAQAGLALCCHRQGLDEGRVDRLPEAPAVATSSARLSAVVGLAAARAACRVERAHGPGAFPDGSPDSKQTRSRPDCLARYRARSARAIRLSRLSSGCRQVTPMLTLISRVRWSWVGASARTCCLSFSASWRADSRDVSLSSRTNSSPPQRERMSERRK